MLIYENKEQGLKIYSTNNLFIITRNGKIERELLIEEREELEDKLLEFKEDMMRYNQINLTALIG